MSGADSYLGSELGEGGDDHAVADGQSQKEVSDVGELQRRLRGNGSRGQNGRTEPAQLPHQLRVWYHLLGLVGGMEGRGGTERHTHPPSHSDLTQPSQLVPTLPASSPLLLKAVG